jgi:FkbM family methyltransferase
VTPPGKYYMLPVLKRTLRQLHLRIKGLKPEDGFLASARGIIHVGANTGQERDRYWRHRLPVLWVEPIPEVFAMLQKNLAGYPNQRAVPRLVTHEDGVACAFNVSSNNGQSSSILALHEHKAVWPGVSYARTLTLKSVTLPTLLREEGVDATRYDALVMDTQGSELLVLRGAVPLLGQFRFIKAEAPDFESYKGCCLLADLDEFLGAHGFGQILKTRFPVSVEGKHYYDVVYERTGS